MNLANGTIPGPVAPWFSPVQPWLPRAGGSTSTATPYADPRAAVAVPAAGRADPLSARAQIASG